MAQTSEWVPAAHSQTTVTPSNESRKSAALQSLLTEYFHAPDEGRRDSIASAIDAAADGSVESVARALGDLNLWKPRTDRTGEFSLELPSGEPLAVTYRLPSHYDPSRRYPLLVCMPDSKASPDQTLALAACSLGKPADDFVLASSNRPVGGAFYLSGSHAADVPALLRGVRRQFRTDTQRTFLFGCAGGGDAVWMAAIMYADLFAGAIVVDSYPHLPYVEQSYRLFLENLSNTPFLTAWRAAKGSPAASRRSLIASHNALIHRIAKQGELPIDGLELPADSASPPKLPANSVTAILARHSPQAPRTVTHWFRYPSQGRTPWLRATELSGPVWRAEQLTILPAPGTDGDDFIASVLTSKLGYLGASVTGQVVNVETQRCTRIEVQFPDGLVNLSQDVTVRCNGTQRHDGPIRPNIGTLLQTAYEAWDFQRLVLARRFFNVASDRKPPQ